MALTAQFDSEDAAIESIRAGDRSVFEGLVRRNSRWVRGVVFGVLGESSSRDRVDDVVQQVWQTVWHRACDLRDVSQWRPWMYRLARNAAINAGRDHTRRKRLAQRAGEAPSEPVQQTPERQMVARETKQAVLQAVQGLPALYREPFVLRHVEGWSYRQIAETMNLPTATVETRLVRARQLLREALSGKV